MFLSVVEQGGLGVTLTAFISLQINDLHHGTSAFWMEWEMRGRRFQTCQCGSTVPFHALRSACRETVTVRPLFPLYSGLWYFKPFHESGCMKGFFVYFVGPIAFVVLCPLPWQWCHHSGCGVSLWYRRWCHHSGCGVSLWYRRWCHHSGCRGASLWYRRWCHHSGCGVSLWYRRCISGIKRKLDVGFEKAALARSGACLTLNLLSPIFLKWTKHGQDDKCDVQLPVKAAVTCQEAGARSSLHSLIWYQ